MVYPPTSALIFGAQAMFTLNTNGMHRTVMPWTWRVFVAPWAGLKKRGDDWGTPCHLKAGSYGNFHGENADETVGFISFGHNFWILWHFFFFGGII